MSELPMTDERLEELRRVDVLSPHQAREMFAEIDRLRDTLRIERLERASSKDHRTTWPLGAPVPFVCAIACNKCGRNWYACVCSPEARAWGGQHSGGPPKEVFTSQGYKYVLAGTADGTKRDEEALAEMEQRAIVAEHRAASWETSCLNVQRRAERAEAMLANDDTLKRVEDFEKRLSNAEAVINDGLSFHQDSCASRYPLVNKKPCDCGFAERLELLRSKDERVIRLRDDFNAANKKLEDELKLIKTANEYLKREAHRIAAERDDFRARLNRVKVAIEPNGPEEFGPSTMITVLQRADQLASDETYETWTPPSVKGPRYCLKCWLPLPDGCPSMTCYDGCDLARHANETKVEPCFQCGRARGEGDACPACGFTGRKR